MLGVLHNLKTQIRNGKTFSYIIEVRVPRGLAGSQAFYESLMRAIDEHGIENVPMSIELEPTPAPFANKGKGLCNE